MKKSFNITLTFMGIDTITPREEEILQNRIEAVLIENGHKISDLVYSKYDSPLITVEPTENE